MGIPLIGALLGLYIVLGVATPRYNAWARLALLAGTAIIIGAFYVLFW